MINVTQAEEWWEDFMAPSFGENQYRSLQMMLIRLNSVANVAILLLDLATFQATLGTFFCFFQKAPSNKCSYF